MEKLDLTQILKDCPEGTKLYSVICGEVKFKGIVKNDLFPVEVKDVNLVSWHFSKKGTYSNIEDAECTLFPSKTNRDWSTFKTESEQPQFKPFEAVLVLDTIDGFWDADFYAYFDTDRGLHQCIMHSAKTCLPYEGNEHLLGTNDEPKGKEE